ncbi:unnamed protein product [Brassica rapa]|uniref:Uncharacterized protein n=1 Tax=Brassica campestris TaxID=3711 RepID=A0A8D9CUV4_BRACM|nr:unnamed protein product [Brassica rapa]
MDSHRHTHVQPQTSCVCLRTHTNVIHTRTHTDVLCVLTDSHKQPRTSCVCWQTPMDVLYSPLGIKSPKQSTGRASVLSPRTNSTARASMQSPRTNVLICVLMDSHRRPVCADGHTRTATDILCMLTDRHERPVCADRHPRTSCTHADTHGRPVCADGQPQTAMDPRTSCVCWRTPTDALCVLNRQPTWDKITQTVHGKGQRAESKDQRADMCTEGQPRTSCLTDTDGHTRTATDVLCVLADTHGRPVSTNSHRRPVCAGGHPRTSCVHGRPVCAGGHPRTSYSARGPKSPKQSTGRASVLSPRTSVLICVLMDSHGRLVCADGHTRTHTDRHRRPVCAGGHPRTPRGPKSPKQSTGRASVQSPRTNMLICVLMDSHRRPVCADGHTRTAMDVLCMLTDTHGLPVCADRHPRTSCVC